MPITVTCALCGEKLTVRDEMAGKTGKCPGCGGPVRVPDAAGAAEYDPWEVDIPAGLTPEQEQAAYSQMPAAPPLPLRTAPSAHRGKRVRQLLLVVPAALLVVIGAIVAVVMLRGGTPGANDHEFAPPDTTTVMYADVEGIRRSTIGRAIAADAREDLADLRAFLDNAQSCSVFVAQSPRDWDMSACGVLRCGGASDGVLPQWIETEGEPSTVEGRKAHASTTRNFCAADRRVVLLGSSEDTLGEIIRTYEGRSTGAMPGELWALYEAVGGRDLRLATTEPADFDYALRRLKLSGLGTAKGFALGVTLGDTADVRALLRMPSKGEAEVMVKDARESLAKVREKLKKLRRNPEVVVISSFTVDPVIRHIFENLKVKNRGPDVFFSVKLSEQNLRDLVDRDIAAMDQAQPTLHWTDGNASTELPLQEVVLWRSLRSRPALVCTTRARQVGKAIAGARLDALKAYEAIMEMAAEELQAQAAQGMAHARYRQAVDLANLGRITAAMGWYYEKNSRTLPPTLAVLPPGYLKSADLLRSPIDDAPPLVDGVPCSYVFVGSVPPEASSRDIIVAYTRKGLFPDGRHVMHGKLGVLWAREKDLASPDPDVATSLMASYRKLVSLMGEELTEARDQELRRFYEIDDSALAAVESRERRPDDRANVEKIAGALRSYRVRHDAGLPPTLAALAPDYLEDAALLRSPVDADPPTVDGVACSYVFVGPLTPKWSGRDPIVAYTRKGVFPDGRHVAYFSGKVSWVSEKELAAPNDYSRTSLRASYKTVLKELAQGLTPERDEELRRFYEIHGNVMTEAEIRQAELNAAREAARRRSSDRSNLNAVSQALRDYLREHGGAFPPTLAALAQSHLGRASALRSPADDNPPTVNGMVCSYVYVGPLILTPRSPRVIVAYTRKGVFPDGRHVVLSDARVSWASEEQLADPNGDVRRSLGASHRAVLRDMGVRLTEERKKELKRFYEIDEAARPEPAPRQPEQPTRPPLPPKASDRTNLRQIAAALRKYRMKNAGALPPTLKALAPDYLKDAAFLHSPADANPPSVNGVPCSYVYAGPIPVKPRSSRAIIAYTRKGVIPGGRHVLVPSGLVSWASEEQLADPKGKMWTSLRASYEAVLKELGDKLTAERKKELKRFYEIE